MFLLHTQVPPDRSNIAVCPDGMVARELPSYDLLPPKAFDRTLRSSAPVQTPSFKAEQ